MDHRVLWIEEEGDDLSYYAAPLLLAGYAVDIAHSVTEAIARLQEDVYDVVICDLLLNAGQSPEWQKLDSEIGEQRKELYLGLHFLRAVFSSDRARVALDGASMSISPDRVAVFTVVSDPDVHDELREMGVAKIKVKGRSHLAILKEIAEEILV